MSFGHNLNIGNCWSVFMRSILSALFLCLSTSGYADYYMLNEKLRVQDFIDQEGNLYLFRYISQTYVPGKRGIVSLHTGLISYTINPLIFVNGTSFGGERNSPQILISKHKSTKGLFFINSAHEGLGKNPLRLNTQIADFNKLTYEVEVPVGSENVIAAIPLAEFLLNMEGLRDIQSKKDYYFSIKKILPTVLCKNILKNL